MMVEKPGLDAEIEREERPYYSAASERCAEQTKAQAARKRHEQEIARLRRLGADEEWLARVATAAEGGAK